MAICAMTFIAALIFSYAPAQAQGLPQETDTTQWMWIPTAHLELGFAQPTLRERWSSWSVQLRWELGPLFRRVWVEFYKGRGQR